VRTYAFILVIFLLCTLGANGQSAHSVTVLGELSYVSVGSDSKGQWKLESAKGTVEVRFGGAGFEADTVLSFTVIGQPNGFEFTVANVPAHTRLLVTANVEPDRVANVSSAAAKVKVYVDQYMAGADFSAGSPGATASCEVFVGAIPNVREMKLMNKVGQ
jgi:hypothetical protein